MNKICVLLLAGLALFISHTASSQVIRGDGTLKTDIREISGFNEIIAQGRFNLVLTQGETEGVRIVSDENILELFQTRLDGKVLYITMVADVRKTKDLSVYISLKELNNIVLLGEVALKSETVIHFDELSIFSGGLSQINLELFASNLTIQLTDGTYAYLKGYSEKFNVEAHDETELNSFDMQTDFCNILSSGLTEVMVYVEKDLKLLVTGASNLYYTGDAKITHRVFSSTGFIVKRQRKN